MPSCMVTRPNASAKKGPAGALVLRKVGAIDAVAYRQLTGCSPKLVAKELSGIKDQGLMIQKGRARGTYYVPAEILLEDIKESK